MDNDSGSTNNESRYDGGANFPYFATFVFSMFFFWGLIRVVASRCSRRNEETDEQREERRRQEREDAIRRKEAETKQRAEFVNKHLQSYTYKKKNDSKLDVESQTECDDDVCAICLSTLSEGDRMAKPSGPTCTHDNFHYDCLAEYLSKKQVHCPICRGVFMEEDVQPDEKATGDNRRSDGAEMQDVEL